MDDIEALEAAIHQAIKEDGIYVCSLGHVTIRANISGRPAKPNETLACIRCGKTARLK